MEGNDFLLEQLRTQGLDDKVCERIQAIGDLREKVIAVLKTVHDPEIPVNIWDLGLVYNVDISAETNDILVEMSLTAPACPIADAIPKEVQDRLEGLIGADCRGNITVVLVWDPQWTPDMMSDDARLIMQMF